jgi:hypothetical protein
MEFDRKEFKKKFPNLYKELDEPGEEESPGLDAQDTKACLLSEFTPEIMSYIRRARTRSEALEVVTYLRRRGEISEKQASSLAKQIEEKGIRSFGPLRTWGHYEREFRRRSPEKLDDEDEEEDQKVD